jgi:predicted hotdog family 3-hydroxylacyl-ACP dehydratase
MLEKAEIEELVPHRGAMCLLERVTRFDADGIECVAISHRDPHNPLRHAERLPAHTAIEYAAQAAAVHGGLLNRQSHRDGAAPRGYLVVVSNLHWWVERLDDLHSDLRIRAGRTAATPGGIAYRVEIEHEGQSIASGDIVIALEATGVDR